MPLLKKFFLGLIALLLLGLAWLLSQEPKLATTSFFISPLAPEQETKSVLESPRLNLENPRLSPDRLVFDLQSFLATQSGTWGIAVTSLNSNSQQLTVNTFGVNPDRSFPAASVMKVLVAANLINRVDKGEFSLERKINGRTLEKLCEGMINRTDNEAWEILNDFLGLQKIQAFGKSLGMENLNIYQNTLSPRDVNTLLTALYQKKTSSAKLTSLLLSFMQNTETEDRIPQALPLGVTVYHKAGSWPETRTYSDAAIVEAKKPFILTILCEGAPNRNLATHTIQTVTQKTFNFLTTSSVIP